VKGISIKELICCEMDGRQREVILMTEKVHVDVGVR
jgi:hypothetical protein